MLHEMQMHYSELVMRKLSVHPSNAWIVTKRKKDLSRFLYHMKII